MAALKNKAVNLESLKELHQYNNNTFETKENVKKINDAIDVEKKRIDKEISDRESAITDIDSNKITKPAETPTIGKIIRVKSVNEDGTFVCEWADSGGSKLDVRINGESIVQDGVAEMPMMGNGKSGLIQFRGGYGLQLIGNYLLVAGATKTEITNRTGSRLSICADSALDYAVKAAMCDGKGTAWTAEEQAAARERMGVYDWEDILDITLEEDGAVDLDLNGTFKDLYLYINQSNVETPITGATFLIPYCVDDFDYFNSYYPSITTSFKDIAAIWHYNENMAYRYACATNPQKESTGTQIACLKVWDKNNRTDSKIYPSGAFIKLKGLTVWKAKTRIVVKGVRA